MFPPTSAQLQLSQNQQTAQATINSSALPILPIAAGISIPCRANAGVGLNFIVIGNSMFTAPAAIPNPIPPNFFEWLTTAGVFNDLNFGQAIELLKLGYCVSRKNFPQLGMTIRMHEGRTSFEQWVPEHFEAWADGYLVAAAWGPTQADMVAHDWFYKDPLQP